MAAQPNTIQQQGLQNGVIAGILYVMYIVVLYMMGGDMLFNTWVQLGGHLILILMMVFTIQIYRKQNGWFVTFQQAFGGSFAVAAVAFIFVAIFNVILYSVIDPDLVVRQKQYIIEQTMEWLQWSNMSEEMIDAQLDKIKEQDYSPNLKNSLLAYAGALVFSAIYAAILALIFWLISRKYEPAPQFNTQSSEILDN